MILVCFTNAIFNNNPCEIMREHSNPFHAPTITCHLPQNNNTCSIVKCSAAYKNVLDWQINTVKRLLLWVSSFTVSKLFLLGTLLFEKYLDLTMRTNYLYQELYALLCPFSECQPSQRVTWKQMKLLIQLIRLSLPGFPRSRGRCRVGWGRRKAVAS